MLSKRGKSGKETDKDSGEDDEHNIEWVHLRREFIDIIDIARENFESKEILYKPCDLSKLKAAPRPRIVPRNVPKITDYQPFDDEDF